MGFGKVKKGLEMNDFETQLKQIEKMYPGKLALVSLPINRIGRVIDFHKAPVEGYYNPDKDLISVEILAKIKGTDKYAPTDPAKIVRTRTDSIKLIGVI